MVFDVRDLMKLVRLGLWRPASYYLLGFLHCQPTSYECELLLVFLEDLKHLNYFAEGDQLVTRSLSDWFLSIYKKPVLDKYPCFSTLVADVLFLRSDHARSFFNLPLISISRLYLMSHRCSTLTSLLILQCIPEMATSQKQGGRDSRGDGLPDARS